MVPENVVPASESPVLIITHTDDTHADKVAHCLSKCSIPVWRIDTDVWPPKWGLTLKVSDVETSCSLRTAKHERISLAHVRSIWFRRIVDPCTDTLTRPDLMRLVVSERQEAINALLSTYQGLILCNPLDYRLVDNKIVQTQLAREAGFRVPETLVTSIPEDAQQFASDQSVVFKLQRSVYVHRQNAPHTVYTSKVDPHQLEAARIELTPCLLQEYKDKSFELRVTVVGDTVFACKIDSQASPHTMVDYRKYDFNRVAHTSFELPNQIAGQSVDLVRRCGLLFATMDIVVDLQGEYYFLDLNPNGQWLWTEELAGLPISEAIAGVLAAPGAAL